MYVYICNIRNEQVTKSTAINQAQLVIKSPDFKQAADSASLQLAAVG
jgi:hypothetical protein